MKKQGAKAFGFLLAVSLLSSCTSFTNFTKVEPQSYPKYTYQQPFDLVFLTVLETIDTNSNWMIHLTNKPAGFIDVKNVQYGNMFDLDTQSVRFVVALVSRKETSLELDPAHSKCKGDACRTLLEEMNERIHKLPVKENAQEEQNT